MSIGKRATAACAVAGSLLLSGCGYEGLNSFTLPGTEGRGGYTVELELENAMDLVPNSPVLVDDLKAGTVTDISLEGHQPVVTVMLREDVELPANATAKIGQTSLLGAKHVEINSPADAEPTGRLADGARVPLSQTGVYPATEDVLASVSALLNGGGLAQLKTITTEMNKVLGGRTETVRSLLTQADTFTASLDAQKTDMTTAIDSLNRIGAEFSAGNATIASALEALPPALDVLTTEREEMVRTFESMGEFGVEMDDLVGRAGDDLVYEIDALEDVVRRLADAGPDLVQSLNMAPGLIFHNKDYDQFLKGDYIDLWATVDLGLDTLDSTLLTGTPLEGALAGANGILGQLLTGAAGGLANPLTGPVAEEEPAPITEEDWEHPERPGELPSSWVPGLVDMGPEAPGVVPSTGLLGGLLKGLLSGGAK